MNKKKEIVIGIIQDESGRILICERLDPEVKEAHQKWDIPGGTVEPNEELTSTLMREVIEEVGISINIDEKNSLDRTQNLGNTKWFFRNCCSWIFM